MVNVPVLSKTTSLTLANFSMKLLPLINIPLFEANPIPAKKVNGIDITNAQGQEITRKVSALLNQTRKLKSLKNGTINAKTIAKATTEGV